MPFAYQSFYLDDPIVTGRALDIFTPDECTKETALLIVHGGGWRAGGREKLHGIMHAFCRRGYIVASADYRLNAPSAFEQLADLREAYDLLVSRLKASQRPLKIAVYGESAGAHLGSLLVCAKPGEAGESTRLDNAWVQPVQGIFQATPMDFLPWEGMMPAFWNQMQNIAGAPYDQDPERYRRLSLKSYWRPDNPPIFFLEAELEHLFLSRHTLAAVRQHRAWGIPSQWMLYPLSEHGFFYELRRPAQLQAFDDICAFLDGTLNTQP